MTTAVQHRRGTTAEHAVFTGLEGEVTIDTTKDTAVIHDGTLAGGYPLAKENLANVTTSGLSSIDGASTASDDKFFIYDQSATTLKTITRAELNNAMEQDALANVSITGGTINGTTIGGTTAAAVSATTLTTSSTVTHNGGTANGVAYLNGSKVLTTGSALTFDGTNLTVPANVQSEGNPVFYSYNGGAAGTVRAGIQMVGTDPSVRFTVNNTEGMRLTSTGLGIGTSSPSYKLHVISSSDYQGYFRNSTSTTGVLVGGVSGGGVVTSDSSGTPLFFGIGGTTKATIDISGNLGLGVTPSAWRTTEKALQIGSTGSLSSFSNATVSLSQNTYTNTSSQNIYLVSSFASSYVQTSGQHRWYTAPSGTAGNAISFTQAMTLDASGRLGIGTTSPVGSLSAVASGDNTTVAVFGGTSGGTSRGLRIATGIIPGVSSNNEIAILDAQSNLGVPTMDFQTAGTTRVRIDSSGNLLVGTTSSTIPHTLTSGSGAMWHNDRYISIARSSDCLFLNRVGTNGGVVRFYRDGTNVGSITVTTTATSYVTSSDYRLKENIAPMTGALAKVAALKPVTYTWKADGSDGEGFIAHELAEVVPGCVTGEKDAVDDEGKPVYQGIDTSFLAGLYAAAIQELKAELDSVKAELVALKGAA